MKYKILGGVLLVLILTSIYIVFGNQVPQEQNDGQSTESTSTYSGIGK